jgi:hypothetical protein
LTGDAAYSVTVFYWGSGTSICLVGLRTVGEVGALTGLLKRFPYAIFPDTSDYILLITPS